MGVDDGWMDGWMDGGAVVVNIALRGMVGSLFRGDVVEMLHARSFHSWIYYSS